MKNGRKIKKISTPKCKQRKFQILTATETRRDSFCLGNEHLKKVGENFLNMERHTHPYAKKKKTHAYVQKKKKNSQNLT